MQARDVAAVSALEAAAYSHPWSEKIIEGCLRVGFDAWVGEVNGLVMTHCIVQNVVGEAHLLNLCVHPTLQGRGLGKRLLGHALNRCEALDCFRVILEVRPSNKPAYKLYKRAGFHRIGVREGYYPTEAGPREDAWVLAKDLGEVAEGIAEA